MIAQDQKGLGDQLAIHIYRSTVGIQDCFGLECNELDFVQILQWDFEEENAPWKKSKDSQQSPQQDWPRKPKLYSNATTGFLQKTLSGTQECDGFSSESLIK